MNIHDLTTNPYTATRGSAYIIVYLIPRTVLKIRRPNGNGGAAVPVDLVRLRITAGSRHYADSLHIIHSDWDSIKFWLDQVPRPTPTPSSIRLVLPFLAREIFRIARNFWRHPVLSSEAVGMTLLGPISRSILNTSSVRIQIRPFARENTCAHQAIV